jgi:hypothetical protein
MDINAALTFSIFSDVAYFGTLADPTIADRLNASTFSNQFTDISTDAYDPSTGASRYYVRDSSTVSTPNSSGFAAVTILDRATGQTTIAFRGTEITSTYNPDYGADLQIGVLGTAQYQIIDMYNYLCRAFAPEGSSVSQYAFTDTTDAPPAGTHYTTSTIDSDESTVTVYHYLKVASTTTGLGLVPNGATVDFTGHSLGGHLALAASRLFSGLTDQVYTYNAPGFMGSSVDAFFNYFPNAASVFPQGNTYNVYADDTPSFVSSRWLFNYPGTDVPVTAEGRGIESHGIQFLDESLAVYNLLSQLDPTLSMSQIQSIIRCANSSSDRKLEATIDALRAAATGDARMGECYLGSLGICSHMPTSVSNSPVSGM